MKISIVGMGALGLLYAYISQRNLGFENVESMFLWTKWFTRKLKKSKANIKSYFSITSSVGQIKLFAQQIE